jgi:hypothetical protein
MQLAPWEGLANEKARMPKHPGKLAPKSYRNKERSGLSRRQPSPRPGLTSRGELVDEQPRLGKRCRKQTYQRLPL